MIGLCVFWIENMERKIRLRNTSIKSVDKIVKEVETIIAIFETDKIFNERIIALCDTTLEKH